MWNKTSKAIERDAVKCTVESILHIKEEGLREEHSESEVEGTGV